MRQDRPVAPHLTASVARPLGIALGVLADRVLGDPRRLHPVAGFGRAATWLEHRWYADDVWCGARFTAVAVGVPVAVGVLAERATVRHPVLRTVLTAAGTWAVLGGASLATEGEAMAATLERGDLGAARSRLSHLCARDPAGMSGDDLARATVESLAENASDAVVAPLLWGAVAGLPGLLGYRAVNTLDAMVGYTSARYLRFGRVPAKLDDAVNIVPSRVTGAVVAAVAPVVAGSPAAAWQVMRRDGGAHPSPNAGRPEAATAGALGLRLGGENVYDGQAERRPVLGRGRSPVTADIRRAVRLGRAVAAVAAVLSVGTAAAVARVSPQLRRGWLRPERPVIL
jgi:adenosylcobinamide-phosphate synthase